ncbi:hypothetical protein As57867_017032, partial [Aphanomyces stellatus]
MHRHTSAWIVVAAILAPRPMTAQNLSALPRCNASLSRAFASTYTRLLGVCQLDLGVDGASVIQNPNFCTTPSCIGLASMVNNTATTCRPNTTTDLVPVQVCAPACSPVVLAMTSHLDSCKANNPTSCAECAAYRQTVDTFVSTCGAWDSATTLRNQSVVNPAYCQGQTVQPPTPASSHASKHTTEIVLGVLGGVVVLGALVILCLKRTSKTRQGEAYLGGIGSPDQTNDAQQTSMDTITLKNDIRFDAKFDQFRIPQQEIQNISLLVKGGYGVVFHATFGKMDVAMKQLLPSKAKDPNAIQDFMNEIRLCARLEHPKIVKFVGISWSTLQDLAVLSEFMSNGDVTGLIRKERKKPEGQRLLHWLPTPHFGATKTSIAADVVDALVYLH